MEKIRWPSFKGVLALPLQDLTNTLDRLRLNTNGTKQALVKRLCFASLLEDRCHEFDFGVLDYFSRNRDLLQKNEQLVDIASGFRWKNLTSLEIKDDELATNLHELFEVYMLIEKLLMSPRPSDAWLLFDGIVTEIRMIFKDLRREGQQKPSKDLTIEEEVRKKLGFGREDLEGDFNSLKILSCLTEKHGLKISAEYERHKEYLRNNMLILVQKMMEEEKYSQSLNFRYGNEVPNELKDDCGNVNFDELTLQAIYNAAKKMHLKIAFANEKEFLERLDEVLDSMKKHINRLKDPRPDITVASIYATLPGYEEDKSIEVLRVFVPPEAVYHHSISGMSFELEELGLKVGWYQLVPTTLTDATNCQRKLIFKDLTEAVNEDSPMNLEELVASIKTLKIRGLRISLPRDEVVSIEYQDDDWWKLDSLSLKGLETVPCKPTILRKDGITFARLLIQVQWTDRSKRIEKLVTAKPMYEAGATLAKLLQCLDTMQFLSFKEKLDVISAHKQLLYETSSAVLKHVFDLGGLLTQYWLDVLELSNQYDQAYYREAKQLVYKMLTEGDGKNVAIVSTDHLRYCKKIFAELTHHQFEKVSLEQSNFQSMLRVLRQANAKSGGFFMAVTILDKLAPLDIATLIDSQKDTSSYLLIVDYPNLRASLDSTGKLQSVMIPLSFNSHFRHTVTPYDDTTVVGKCVLAGTKIVAENMAQMEETVAADLARILKIQHENYQWPDKVQGWRNLPLDITDSKGKNVFGILISGDELYVDKCFSGDAILKDCATSTDLDNKFAEKIASSIALTPVKPMKVKDELVTLLVFKKAHLLSEAHKSFIASSCITHGWKFIFVYPYFDPRHTSVKIKDAKTNQDAVCKAEVWQPITAINNVEYRYLRVLFDPLIIPHSAIEKAVDNIKSQADFVKNTKQTIDYSAHVFRQLKDGKEVAINDLLTKILCVVYEYVNRRASEIWEDVSFASFVRFCPACQWVSQELRVELWLRTIYFQLKKEVQLDSMTVKSPNNVHSLHLMEYFDDETPVATPSYQGFDGDELYQQDIILQRCSKSEELGWKIIQEQWGQFPYSSNYLLALVQSYSQPLKLLLNISEISLHNVLSGVGKTQEYVHSFQYLKASLSTAWNGFFDLLAEEVPFIKRFLASVKWNFFACLDEDRHLTFSPSDIECLVETHIPIVPTLNPKIIPTLLALDGPRGILKNQIHVRHFLENITTEGLDILIVKSNTDIGPATIEFILFLSETNVTSNLLFYDLFKFFYKWNKSEDPAVLAQYVVEHQVLRLKDSALSFCLTLQLDADKRTSLVPLFSLLHSKGRRISAIIHDAIKSTNSINTSHCFANIILILEQLQLSEKILVENAHWNAIISSIQQSSPEPLKNYVACLLNGDADNNGQIIPVESSIKLQNYYLEIFSDKAINWPKCDNLKVLLLLQSRLLSNAGRNSLRVVLANVSSTAHNFLNYYLWMLQPSDILKEVPTEVEIKPVKEMLQDTEVGFIQKCCENFFSLSTTALHFVAPCLLTAEVLGRFHKVMPQPHVLLESPCRVTCNYRPLPRSVIDYMVQMYHPDEGQIAHWKTPSENSDEYRAICSVLLHVDVTSGINQEILNKNVTVLALILEHSEFVMQREREAGLFVTSTFVAHLCYCWLLSAGFGTTDIRKMLQNKAFVDVDLGELTTRLSIQQKANLTIPIPTQVNIDPYFNRALKTHSLFGKWNEDMVYTAQVVNSLCKHIGIPDKDMRMSPENIIGSIVKDILELLSEGKGNRDTVLISTVHFIKQLWRDNDTLCLLMATSLSTKLFTDARKIAVSTFSTIINLIGFSAPYWELLAHTILTAANLKPKYFLSSTDLSSIVDLTMFCKVTQPKSTLNKLTPTVIGTLSGGPLPIGLSLSDLANVRDDLPNGNVTDFHSVAKVFGEQQLVEVLFNHRSNSYVDSDSVVSIQRDNLELKTSSNVVLMLDSHAPDVGGPTSEGQVEDIFVTKETKQSPITYYCFSILQMRRQNPYMEIYVPYGKSCYLVQLGEEPDHVMVVPDEDVQPLLQLIKAHKSPSNIVFDYLAKKFDYEDTSGIEKYIIGTFPSYDVALDYIWRSAPPLSLILAHTFSCKRHLNGPNWSMCQINLNHVPHFYELVQFHNLINVPLSVQLKNVLLLLCRVLYQKYNSDGKEESAQQVYDWFNSTLPKDIEEQAGSISEFVCAVIDRSRDSRMAISSIIQDIATDDSKYYWMLETWPEFKGKLAFHLARNIANFATLKCLLTRSAVSFKHLLYLAKKSEEEFNNLSAMLPAISVDADPKTEHTEDNDESDDAMELDFNSDFNSEESLYEINEEEDEDKGKRFQHPFAVMPQPFDGFGYSSITHQQQLLALTKLHTDYFFYTWFIDLHRHKPEYDMTNGRLLALILPSSLFAQSKAATDVFLSWLAVVLRSPLSVDLKEWFMQRCRANFLHPPPISEDNQLQLQIIASCISKACPDYQLKQYFTGSFVLRESVAKFCQRTNDEYGIYVCNTGYLQQLAHQKILVKELDLSLAAAGTVTPDKHYLNILSLFAGMTSFVYVRGLRVIDDLLLKWCAEFTKEFPWRFIFFENTSTMFNFSENRDRCKLSLYLPPTLEEMQRDNTYQMQICQTDCQRFDTWQYMTTFNIPRSRTEAIPDWENNLKAGIKNDPLIIFLVSPPGAGKTFLLEQEIMAQEAQRGCFCKRIDCSNDILVQKAMETVLSDQFPEEGKKSLLVADEFHMLSEAHKNALFDWIFPRLHWLKVVLIGNRSNDQDQDLLERVNKRSNSTFAQLIRCRLSVDKVLSAKSEVFNQNIEKDFIRFWQRSVRALFSELSLSLRNIEPILRAFRSTNPEVELTNLLNNKMPMLGQLCCITFVRCLLDLFQNRYNCVELPTKETNSIRLLVITSLADETDSVMSYSEFITKLPKSNQIHPIVRLGSWITYVYQFVHPNTPPKELIDNLPLDILKKLKLIDQHVFPLITKTESAVDLVLERFDAFASTGNYSDLKWMADSIEHGYSINWRRVKEEWSANYVLDAKEFDRLLSVYSDVGVILSIIQRPNLCTLLERRSETSLALSVVKHFRKLDNEEQDPQSPYFTAAWFLFRHLPVQSAVAALKTSGVDLLKTLVWASEFGFTKTGVKDNSTLRNELLQNELVDQSKVLVQKDSSPERGAVLAKLWSDLFAPLLSVGNQVSWLPNNAALLLLQHVESIPSQWPRLMHVLKRILTKKASVDDAILVMNDSFFYSDNMIASDILQPFLAGLLNLQGKATLPVGWQVMILGSCVVLPDMSKEEVKNHFGLGLRHMQSQEDILLFQLNQGNTRRWLEELFNEYNTI